MVRPAAGQYGSHWYGKRQEQARRVIKRWERKFSQSTVRLFVEDALEATRSPGKRDVYKEWLEQHPSLFTD